MKKAVLGILIASFVFGSGKSLAVPSSLSDYGYQTVTEIWNQLLFYGLLEMDPWDPTLPKPQVPALKAVVSKRSGLLVYYDEEIGVIATTLVFKNPNGGQRHSVFFNRNNIEFITPDQGTVANANEYMTVNGPAYNFYCQSRLVTEQSFRTCVDRLFIRVIVDKLRKYAF
jgi:hypothetical protein